MARTVADADAHISATFLNTMVHLRREHIASTLEAAREEQERGRFGWMIATSGESLYD